MLSTLQSDVRANLQIFLHELGDAFIKYGGANGFRELYASSGPAFKYGSLVNAALLGTEPHDLSNLVKNLDSTVAALDHNEAALKSLVTNFRIVTGSFAAQDTALAKGVSELPGVLDAAKPALTALNNSFPPVRAFSVEALPGVRSTPSTLDAATPLLHQLRGLVSKAELRGLTHDLRPAIPDLTKLTKRTIPFLAADPCALELLQPGDHPVVELQRERPGLPLAEDLPGDGVRARGDRGREPHRRRQRRVRAGARAPSGPDMIQTTDSETGNTLFGLNTALGLNGGRPAVASSAKPPYRPDVPCETQEPPNLNSGGISSAPSSPKAGTPSQTPADQQFLSKISNVPALQKDGKKDAVTKLVAKAWSAWERQTKRAGRLMAIAIRKNLRNFIAVVVLIVVALLTSYVILQHQRLRIPILEEKPFELKADFQTAQAVVPGQGQTIDVAGVPIGEVEKVELVSGVAQVTFGIERKYLPIYKNATILMRPRTGLKDMFFEMDPGTPQKSAPDDGVVSEGGTIPLANTAPDVNLDEVLAGLDGDTRAYLRVLLVGAGQGLNGQAKNLGNLLGSVGPLNHDVARVSKLVAERRQNLADLIHNLSVLTKEVGQHSGDINQLVTRRTRRSRRSPSRTRTSSARWPSSRGRSPSSTAPSTRPRRSRTRSAPRSTTCGRSPATSPR